VNSLQKAKTIFEERLYRWSLAEWRREINEGYPLLRRLKYSTARHVVLMMESFSKEHRWQMARALVKRFSPEGVHHCDEEFTEEDRRYIQMYLDMMEKAIWIEASQRPIIALHPEPCLDKLKRKPFRKLLVQRLTPILGADYDHEGGLGWMAYETMVGPWKVRTSIDTGGRYHQLCYDHWILISERERLYEGASLLRWLGISSQTMWQELDNSEAEWAAESLVKIVKHFMDAVPKLLEGLSPDP